MVQNSTMRISPRFTSAHWRALDLSSQRDWPAAIEIFRDRIKGRFLEPINAILPSPWSGFAVLALDSLLVETLQQFWEGQHRTPDGMSITYFTRFLCGPLFPARANGFNAKMARLFYTTVRCGILHQAQVSGSTRVRRTGALVKLNLARPSGKQPQARSRGITVNPLAFHRALERAFESYVKLLQDPAELTRREHFKFKMDGIVSDDIDDVQG
jgi:hypothetical protein